MRGIGKGQTLALFVPPEVRNLQQVEVALGRGVTREARAASLAALPPLERARGSLEDVASWLVLNAMRAEKVTLPLPLPLPLLLPLPLTPTPTPTPYP